MLILHVGFVIKIRDLHTHLNSFLKQQPVKNISELFNKNLSINHQSLYTCLTACRSEHINFTFYNRGGRQHSLLHSNQRKIYPSFQC
jgi:hypothetical protein